MVLDGVESSRVICVPLCHVSGALVQIHTLRMCLFCQGKTDAYGTKCLLYISEETLSSDEPVLSTKQKERQYKRAVCKINNS